MLMVVVTAAAAFLPMLMVVVMFLPGLLHQFRHQVLTAFHRLHNLLALQLLPGGGDDGGVGVLFLNHGHCTGNFFLPAGIGAAQDNGIGMADLVVVKLAKVFHVQFYLVYIGHGHKAVQLHRPLPGNGLHRLGYIAEFAHAGGFNHNPVGLVLVNHLNERLAEIPHQAAADAAGVHLGNLNASFLQKAAINANFAKFVFNQHQLLACVGFGNEFFNQCGFAGSQKAGKDINLGHGIVLLL